MIRKQAGGHYHYPARVGQYRDSQILSQSGIPLGAAREAVQAPSDYGLRAQSLAQSISRGRWTCCCRHPAGHQAGTQATVPGRWAAATC